MFTRENRSQIAKRANSLFYSQPRNRGTYTRSECWQLAWAEAKVSAFGAFVTATNFVKESAKAVLITAVDIAPKSDKLPFYVWVSKSCILPNGKVVSGFWRSKCRELSQARCKPVVLSTAV